MIRTGIFGKAAKIFFVTQPTLSMMIQALEDELGIKIFDRSRQPVVPTEAGEAVIDQAKIIVQEAERMKELYIGCELRKKGLETSNLEYEAGSIATLKKRQI